MRRIPTCFPLLSLPLCLAGLLSCSPAPPTTYTFGGSPSGAELSGGGSSTMPGSTDVDGGGYLDGGLLPTAPCGTDTDGTQGTTPSGLVISELGFVSPGYLGLYNRSNASINLSTYTLEGALTGQLSTGTLSGTTDALVPATLPATSGELALFSSVDAGTPTIAFYTCWGNLGVSTLQSQAVAAQLWESEGTCASIPPTGDTLHLTSAGTFPGDWTAGPPTPYGCAE